MKWFRHECSATHDPKLHFLAAAHGAEGLGVYWGLLEEIGLHSDTLHLKVAGVSAESDQAYMDALLHGEEPIASIQALAAENIPIMDVRILARLTLTTETKLLRVIEKMVELGLLDQSKWLAYGLLHSPDLERFADAYIRRRRKSIEDARVRTAHVPDTVRTHSAHAPDTVRTPSAHVPDTVRTHSAHVPDTVRTPSAHAPDTVRTPSAHVPDTVRTHSAHVPDTVRTHSAHVPASVRREAESLLQRDNTLPKNVRPEQNKTNRTE